jgi:hypothetical protein
VLGVISGFLNPFLLAAAVVGGVAAYVIKGKDFVVGGIRSNVREELEKGLQSTDTRRTLERAFERSMQEVFTRLAASFRGSTGALVGEMRYQQNKFEAELQEKRATLGAPDAVRAEVAELEARAAQVSGALDALEHAAARIEKELVS